MTAERIAVVLGAGGMLGSAVVRSAPAGIQCKALDRAQADITNLSALRETLQKLRPKIIINCAAYTAVDKAEQERGAAFAINSCGARNIAIVARELGARFTHVSTDFVFDGTAKAPYTEADLTNPRGGYAESKHSGEQSIQQIGGDYQIVRTQWLYGKGGKHFVATIAKFAKERDRLTVVSDQRGCPTDTFDLAPRLWKLTIDAPGGLYHASGEGECSWREFAAEIVTCAGSSARVDPITTDDWNQMKPGSAPRPAYSVLSKHRLQGTIGSPFPHWRDSLKAFFDRGDL